MWVQVPALSGYIALSEYVLFLLLSSSVLSHIAATSHILTLFILQFSYSFYCCPSVPKEWNCLAFASGFGLIIIFRLAEIDLTGNCFSQIRPNPRHGTKYYPQMMILNFGQNWVIVTIRVTEIIYLQRSTEKYFDATLRYEAIFAAFVSHCTSSFREIFTDLNITWYKGEGH